MHRRQIVREAAIAQLAGIEQIAGRCFNQRGRPIPEDQLPALRVYTTSESADAEGEMLSAGSPLHRIQLRVEVVAKQADGVEDEVDAICEAVESVIAQDPTLGGATNWTTYQNTELDIDEDADQKVMQASIGFEVEHIQE